MRCEWRFAHLFGETSIHLPPKCPYLCRRRRVILEESLCEPNCPKGKGLYVFDHSLGRKHQFRTSTAEVHQREIVAAQVQALSRGQKGQSSFLLRRDDLKLQVKLSAHALLDLSAVRG